MEHLSRPKNIAPQVRKKPRRLYPRRSAQYQLLDYKTTETNTQFKAPLPKPPNSWTNFRRWAVMKKSHPIHLCSCNTTIRWQNPTRSITIMMSSSLSISQWSRALQIFQKMHPNITERGCWFPPSPMRGTKQNRMERLNLSAELNIVVSERPDKPLLCYLWNR